MAAAARAAPAAGRVCEGVVKVIDIVHEAQVMLGKRFDGLWSGPASALLGGLELGIPGIERRDEMPPP